MADRSRRATRAAEPVPEDPERTAAALRQRYLGTALIGFVILLYWWAKVALAWWGG